MSRCPDLLGRKFVLLVGGVLSLLLGAPSAHADHRWSSYHWERPEADPLSLAVGNCHTANAYNWASLLSSVIANWNSTLQSSGAALQFSGVACNSGDIKSFNGNYGDNGWLGLASISFTRGKEKHIVYGESKMNEYYITLAGYSRFNNATAWQHVLCQEIGHDFGLDHNRDGATGGSPDDTCMNDAVALLAYPSPNSHDGEETSLIYGHDHASTGGGGGGGGSRCHPVFGCGMLPSLAHAFWAEHYDHEEELFLAADAVVEAKVLSSRFLGLERQGGASVPVTQVVLQVMNSYRGQTRRNIVLEQTRGPDLEIVDDPGYVVDDLYLLYLRQTRQNTYRIVNPQGRIRY